MRRRSYLDRICIAGLLAVVFLLTGCAGRQGAAVSIGAEPAPAIAADRCATQPSKAVVEVPVVKTSSRPVKPSTSPAVVVPGEWYPPVPDNGWKVIVLHHSESDFGGAKVFDKWHRARGWDELGYHFVIGNGTDTPDGYIEVGSRWLKQKHGAHTKSADRFYNNYGVGICLVGNFEHSTPTPKQMESLDRLLAFVMQRYHITPDQIYGHREVKGNDTTCPGRYFPLDSLRYRLRTAGE